MHDKLKHMKETLMCAVEMQLCDLGEVDTKELGEVIDMIKDLEEAIYYCTVTEAMTNPLQEKEWKMQENGHHQENGDSRMYYDGPMYKMMYADDGRRRRSDGTFYADSGNSASGSQSYSMYSDSNMNSSNGRNYTNSMYNDSMNGRSYNSRRMYMEAKHSHQDKSVQLRELEKYMQELSQDVVEMIEDASSEEKQYLEKKISALATKIGQMK